MKKYIIGILFLLIGLVLTSCSANGTQVLAKQLRPTELIKTFNTNPPNLAARSKCPSSPSIKIVNAEINDQNHTYYTWWPNEVYITPNKLMDDIVIYMSDAFNRTGIKTDQNSTNIIKVSMEEMTSSYSFLNFSANTQLKIMLPEKQFTKIYSHSDSTPHGPHMAVAYTIHEITWKMINDPFLQNYILCANEGTKDESPTRETALDILKKRYAKGEITKDQFEQMKKDIQDIP